MVISAVIYIMPHRQCYPALWMMMCFIQRTKPCPSRVGRFQHNGKNRTKHQQNGVRMNQTLLSTVPGNWQTIGDSQSFGHSRSWSEEHRCPGRQDVRNIWNQSPFVALEAAPQGAREAPRAPSLVLIPTASLCCSHMYGPETSGEPALAFPFPGPISPLRNGLDVDPV